MVLLSISSLSPLSSPLLLCQAQKFEPYTLNGGLISAVAGQDYVVLASDTRLSDGYEILSRDYLTSRIWSAVPLAEAKKVSANGVSDVNIGKDDVRINQDGSMSILSKRTNMIQESSSLSSTATTIRHYYHSPSFPSPTFIASAGCSTDCEALKRQITSEVNSHVHWNYGSVTLSPSGIANLLGQTLYSRRGFPFYSFCILAGLDCNTNGSNSDKSGSASGVVHIYDAIGSHEKVAVATAGTGREMLQPILDRLFTVASQRNRSKINDDDNDVARPGPVATVDLQRDGRAIKASEQRLGQSLKLQPPVRTCVSCTSDEAVTFLVRGYRSVAEREIAVGDSVVICVLKRLNQRQVSSEKRGKHEGSCWALEVSRFPLKRH